MVYKKTKRRKRRWHKPLLVVKTNVGVRTGPCAGGMTNLDVCDPPIQTS
jgi:hypothetical protein